MPLTSFMIILLKFLLASSLFLEAMQKTLVETIDDGLCEAFNIQHKVFLPECERKYWVTLVKNLMSQQAETKVMIKNGEFKRAQLLRKEIRNQTRKVLRGLSAEYRQCYQAQGFQDPKQGKNKIRVRVCKRAEARGVFYDGRWWIPDKLGFLLPAGDYITIGGVCRPLVRF